MGDINEQAMVGFSLLRVFDSLKTCPGQAEQAIKNPSMDQEAFKRLRKCYVYNGVPRHVALAYGCSADGFIQPTPLRRVYPSLQRFFKKTYPDLLTRHGIPISDADLDRLCGKVLLAFRGVWEQYTGGYVSSQVSTLALCYLHKREALKVAKGDLPIQCVIMPSTGAGSYNVPTPVDRDSDDHFLLRLEVVDPDDPVNNPSMFFVLPKAQDDFFESPGSDGRLECMRWMNKLSGDCGNEHVRVSVTVKSECINRPIVPPSLSGRYLRAVHEDKVARLDICFTCETKFGRKKKKICAGCKRVTYCSTVCQTNNWKEHKPGCKMTLQQIQEKDV